MGFDKHYRKQVFYEGTAVYKLKVYSQHCTPVGVAANTSVEQSFTVTGLATTDRVLAFVPPSGNSGSPFGVGMRVSAANTLTVAFVNAAAISETPIAGTYKIVVIRDAQ